jgi:hypothetical protein
MSSINATKDQIGELTFDSLDRINEIESELMNDGNRSVVIFILFALLLVLVLGGYVTYTLAGESEARATTPSMAGSVIVPAKS